MVGKVFAAIDVIVILACCGILVAVLLCELPMKVAVITTVVNVVAIAHLLFNLAYFLLSMPMK